MDHTAPLCTGPGWVLGVAGASGGLGTSSLTAACATRAADAGHAVLAVDTHRLAGGLDLRLGLDAEPGLRWPDLAGLRGAVDASALWCGLPAVGTLRVLSWDRRPDAAGPTDPGAVVAAVTPLADLVLLDLPPVTAVDADPGWWRRCDATVLLVGGGVDGCLAGCLALEVADVDAVLLRRRSRDGMPRGDVEAVLGRPLLGELPDDPAVPVDLVRGRPVGRRGHLLRCADRVLAEAWVEARRVDAEAAG